MRLRNKLHWRAFALVALLAPALGSTAAAQTDASDLDTPSAPPKQATSENIPGANPLWAIPLATFSNTRERPIFSLSRRPPPPAVAPITVVTAPPPKPARVERPQLSLVGTISGSEQSLGIFVEEPTKAALRLKIGEEYQGWRLRTVAAREATLEHDELIAVLSLPQHLTNEPQPIRMQAKNTDDERLQLRPRRDR